MPRRSERRTSRSEKNDAGCISGLRNMFEFRHKRLNRKLLSNNEHVNNQNIGSGSSGERPKMVIQNLEDAKTNDFVQTSVKKLMEEDMVNEQHSDKPINLSEGSREEFNSNHRNTRKDSRHSSRTSRSSIDMDKTSEVPNMQTLIEELSKIHSTNAERDSLKNDHKSNSLRETISIETPTRSEPRKHRKLFRKRSKSLDSFSLIGEETGHSSSKIVILKPGLGGSKLHDQDKVQGDRHASYLFFTEIKRKLQHAIGKEHFFRSSGHRDDNVKGVGGDNHGWRSPNRNHFYTEVFATPSPSFRRDSIDKSKDPEPASLDNIYIEAKKHLSEMLKNGEDDPDSVQRQSPKSLGGILSLPAYKDLSAWSHEKDIERCPDSSCEATSELKDENTMEGARVSIEDVESSKYNREAAENAQTPTQETDEILNDLDISVNTYPDKEDAKNDNSAICNGNLSSKCSDTDSIEDGAKVEDSEIVSDRAHGYSPISVLEPLYSDDEVSPPRSKEIQVERDIRPKKIDFGEEIYSVSGVGISSISALEDGESPFDYVEAVLLGSDLNWDDFLLRWLSSDQILDPSVFEEVELFSSRHNDQKLLFDCTNEVLKEVCDRYFGFFVCASFNRETIQAAPKGMNLINEIWEGVEWYLFQHLPSKSLDRLVESDMKRSRIWMDLRLDIELIGIEIEAAILENLLEDTLESFLDDHETEISIESQSTIP